MQAGVPELHRMAARLTTVATLPADTWNLARLVHHEVNKHGNVSTTCGRRARTLSAALHASGILSLPKTTSQRGFCDFFAAWGALTEGQRLLSSRNLDFDSNTGLQLRVLSNHRFAVARACVLTSTSTHDHGRSPLHPAICACVRVYAYMCACVCGLGWVCLHVCVCVCVCVHACVDQGSRHTSL